MIVSGYPLCYKHNSMLSRTWSSLIIADYPLYCKQNSMFAQTVERGYSRFYIYHKHKTLLEFYYPLFYKQNSMIVHTIECRHKYNFSPLIRRPNLFVRFSFSPGTHIYTQTHTHTITHTHKAICRYRHMIFPHRTTRITTSISSKAQKYVCK